jgi:hypothetical protein
VSYACLVGCLSSIDKTLGSSLQGEFASLIEFDACCVSPWVQGGYDLLHRKPHVLFTTLLSSELDVCHPYGLVLGEAYDLPWFEGELVLWCVYYIFCFSIVFASYSPKSLGFTYYTSLYLLNYAYHYAKMSSNEM